MSGMSTVPTSPIWRAWVEQYRAHRASYIGATWHWQPHEPGLILTTYTGGRVEFTHARDLAFLLQVSERLQETLAAARDQVAVELAQIRPVMPREDPPWTALAAEFDLHRTRLAVAAGEAEVNPARVPPPGEVAVIRQICDGLAICNPLVVAWELWQVVTLWQAAADTLDDLLADLLLELDLDDGSLLAATAGRLRPAAAGGLIRRQRAMRGEPGDPRRVPDQWQGWSHDERRWSKISRVEADRHMDNPYVRWQRGLPLVAN